MAHTPSPDAFLAAAPAAGSSQSGDDLRLRELTLDEFRRLEEAQSPLYNRDLAPVPLSERTWTTYNFAALWISMAHCIPTYFIAAKLIPLWVIAMVVLSIGLTVARLVFGVPMEGSLFLVFGGAALYLVAALGIGLWVSTVTETQQQAMFVNFSILMVYLLMSGLFTPVSAMPHWAQWVARVNPMAHFITLMRAVLLKGAGIGDVWPQLAVLAVAGTLVLTIAVRQYHKRAA